MIDHQTLLTWTKQYLTSRDAFTKEIATLQETKEWDLTVTLKNGIKRLYSIQEQFDAKELLPRLGTDPVFVILLNTKKNLQELTDHWQALKTFPKLCLVFVNPESQTEKKWLLYPHTHDRITDPLSLKLGLKSMFETVEEVK